MKWTIHELIKKEKNQNDLFFLLDLNRFITEKQEDLVSISETEVSGYYDYYKEEDLIVFDLNVKTVLTMLCSLTLKEVNVSLDFNAVFNFSTVYIDDATYLVEGITIDIDQYIFSEILIEKPMKVYASKALDNYKEDIFVATEEELETNSPFAKLKK
ncbi:MAG: hypothetical protein KAH13_01085 [Tenericutes bacterium]|nr:hypothetical protein [Mycoplasmatota bacterium]